MQSVYTVYACMDGWLCASLEPERFNGIYSYSILKSLSVIGWWPKNTNILTPKIRAPQMDPKRLNGDFLENGYMDFDQILVIGGDSLNNLYWCYLQKINCTSSKGPNGKYWFCRIRLYWLDGSHFCTTFSDQQWSTEQNSTLFPRWRSHGQS
jgi:hypothetical protein